MIRIEELPTHRFYYSITSMAMDMNNEKGKEYFSVLYPWINSYFEESLALLRVDNTFRKIVNEQEKEFDLNYSKLRAYIDEEIIKVENTEEEEEEEILRYKASMLLQSKREYYGNSDLEKNVFTIGTIVQFLSLLESTLHSLYHKLLQLDKELSGINEVCKRDKGIIKYLKYFEKVLISNPKSVLVGTSDFQNLLQWISFRNNIVHNNNDIKQDLEKVINQRNLDISTSKGKYVFNESNIQELAALCGKTLDVLIEKLLMPYLISIDALEER